MDRESKMIHNDMEQTRSNLAEKLETLERKVTGTVQDATEVVQDATAAVSNTVETVQGAVQETVATVKETVQEAVGSVKDAFDISRQVDRHPWLMMGGAVAVGFLGERLLGGAQGMIAKGPEQLREGLASVVAASAKSMLGNGVERKSDHANGKHKVPEETPALADAEHAGKEADDFGGLLQAELGQLKKLAIGATLGLVRNLVAKSLTKEISEPFARIMDSVTGKLGGAPLPADQEEQTQAKSKKQVDQGKDKEDEKSPQRGFAWQRA